MKRSRILLVCTIPISLFITMSLSACSFDDQCEITISSETTPMICESTSTDSATSSASGIVSLDVEQSFDDVLNAWSTYLDVDISSQVNSELGYVSFTCQDCDIRYDTNYQAVLESLEQITDEDGHQIIEPVESSYHIVRRLYIDGFCVCEYEDEEWARLAYGERISNIDGIETMDSDSSNGFSCIISGPSGDSLYVTYYCYNCVFYYTYEVDSSNDDYSIYQDLCDSIGLPTSDVMTQIVLGNGGD